MTGKQYAVRAKFGEVWVRTEETYHKKGVAQGVEIGLGVTAGETEVVEVDE